MNWDELRQHSLLATLSSVTPVQCCQAIFLLAAGGVLAVAVMPRDAKDLLLDYGARKAQKPAADGPRQKVPDRGWLLSLVDTITSWTQVPHSWFSAFYVVSLACSVFWLVQYFGDSAVLRSIASTQAAAQQLSATSGQVALGWSMMFLQGARRVYEQWTIIRPSKSTMWVVHWLLGLLFYLTISVSVWVEGSRMTSPRRGNIGRKLLTAA